MMNNAQGFGLQYNQGTEYEDENLYKDVNIVAPSAYEYKPETQFGVDTMANAPTAQQIDMGIGGAYVAPEGATEEEVAQGESDEEKRKREYLERYYAAKNDATATSYGDNGYQYQDVGDSTTRWLGTAIAAGAAFLGTGMLPAAIFFGAKMWNDIGNKQHRDGQKEYLKSKNYRDEDIDAFIQTGDYRYLAERKKDGKRFEAVGGGFVFDHDTGQFVEKPGSAEKVQWRPMELSDGRKIEVQVGADGRDVIDPQTNQPITRSVSEKTDKQKQGSNKVIIDKLDLGDRVKVWYADGSQEVIAKGKLEGEQKQSPSVVKENEADSQIIQQATAPKPADDLYNTFKDKDGKYITESDSMLSSIWRLAGGRIGQPPMGGDFISSLDDEPRVKYEAATRLNSMQENMGIAEARSMGASGINTQAEAERFAKSMPRVDFSSYSNMVASIKRIEEYTNKWNNENAKLAKERIERRGGNVPESTSPQQEYVRVESGYGLLPGKDPTKKESWVKL